MANAGCPLAAVGTRWRPPQVFQAAAKNVPITSRPANHINHGGITAVAVGRVDYDITPRDIFFARYSFEKGKQGQPLVPYYSPAASSVLGAVNTPGYGVNNDTWAHSAAANYVTVLSPTMTNRSEEHTS